MKKVYLLNSGKVIISKDSASDFASKRVANKIHPTTGKFFELNPEYLKSEIESAKIEDDEWHCLFAGGGFEEIPLEAFGSLYIMSKSGAIMEIKRQDLTPEPDEKSKHIRLYLDLYGREKSGYISWECPATFGKNMTIPSRRIWKMFFCELSLDGIDNHRLNPHKVDLPYANIHLLVEVIEKFVTSGKSRMMIWPSVKELPFRIFKNFYIADRTGKIAFYPIPPEMEMRENFASFFGSIKNGNAL
jgi:hypothetical protein